MSSVPTHCGRLKRRNTMVSDQRIAVAFVLLSIVCTSCVTAVGAEPGEKRKLQLAADTARVEIEFVFVPSGTVTPFGKDTATKPSVLTLPFYMMTTEASVQFFDAYAPAAAKKSHAEREKENAGDLLMPDIEKRRAKGADYPVLWVSPSEIASVTARINNELMLQKPESSIVRESVRLPTLAEWRHAMSAGSSPEAGFFNSWPEYTAFAKKDQGMCRDVWSACGGQGEFRGTPEQVLWLIANPGSEGARCYDVATLFTEHLIKGREATGVQPWAKTVDPFDSAETLTAAKPNKWGIYGAHRNPCPEWIIGNDTQAAALLRWRSVEQGTLTSDDRKQKTYALVGARFRLITREKLERFAELLIWSTPEDVSLDDSEMKTIDRKAAFRLVLVESLADDWLRVVRPEILAAESVEKASEIAETRTKDVQRLASASSALQVALIRGFHAVRAYNEANPSLSVDGLQPLLDNLKPGGKVKVDFAAMRRGEAPAPQSKPTGDGIYLSTLVSLIKKDKALSEQ